MEKMKETIEHLKGAEGLAHLAASRLDRQGAWHQEHAREFARLAIAKLELVIRQIDRAQVERAERPACHHRDCQSGDS